MQWHADFTSPPLPPQICTKMYTRKDGCRLEHFLCLIIITRFNMIGVISISSYKIISRLYQNEKKHLFLKTLTTDYNTSIQVVHKYAFNVIREFIHLSVGAWVACMVHVLLIKESKIADGNCNRCCRRFSWAFASTGKGSVGQSKAKQVKYK